MDVVDEAIEAAMKRDGSEAHHSPVKLEHYGRSGRCCDISPKRRAHPLSVKSGKCGDGPFLFIAAQARPSPGRPGHGVVDKAWV